VDLAAEAGGNCEATIPGKLHVHKGVTIIGQSRCFSLVPTPSTNSISSSGYSDLPSRLPTQSSTLYSNNITKFLLSITPPNSPSSFHINLDDEVVRGALVVHHGALLEPVPRAAPAPPPTPPTPSKVAEAEKEARAITPWQKATREVATITAGMGTTVALGKVTGPLFMTNFFTFGLAGLIGYRVVWGVAPALHSPLMSVTNAISGKCSLYCRIRRPQGL
jgi:H+-translocating NAD(P) transhydrogenase